ncbi:TVP38/TMEM64 family protein [Ectobacillus panaciterrae]|uniref:TVP38/TMEM64 family protein n=1 Tax=Ectobacillus panaciterrae TaxID=363872 RepID=UPI0003FFC0C7|nr:VTT domain-containing protein [Ectobacillus panaciterrae]
MKKYLFIIAVVNWMIIIGAAYKFNFLVTSVSDLEQVIAASRENVYLLFCLLFILRLLLFIPSSVFIVVGSILFPFFENILISIVCMLVTSTIIYIAGRRFVNSPIHCFVSQKHPEVYKRIEENRQKYLFLFVLMPIASTDMACFIAASTRMGYIPFIITVFAAIVPFVSLYTFFGKTLITSPETALFITLTIIVFVLLGARMKKKETEKEKELDP